MAITKGSDLKVYNPMIQSGYVETLAQVSQAFNEASAGTIRLVGNRYPGNYKYEAFWTAIANLVSRRDLTSVATATSLAAAQAEKVSVKLNRKFGPVDATRDAFKKIGLASGIDELDFLIGTQVAKAVQVDQCDIAILAARAALNNQAAVKYTVPASATLGTAGLVSGLAKFGDRASQIKCWVMHSKQYYDLVQSQITANITGVSNFNVASAQPVTLNRPVLVCDSPSLIVTGGTSNTPTTDYLCLGLVEGAVIVEDSEEETIVRQDVTGLENLVVRLQGEYAYSLGVMGFTWDVGNGGANPSNSSVGTGTNWDPIVSSYKDYGGIVIQSK